MRAVPMASPGSVSVNSRCSVNAIDGRPTATARSQASRIEALGPVSYENSLWTWSSPGAGRGSVLIEVNGVTASRALGGRVSSAS